MFNVCAGDLRIVAGQVPIEKDALKAMLITLADPHMVGKTGKDYD
jgi:hypothetical protein